MSDYKQEGNRWTAIYVRSGDGHVRLPYDLVRFNVDTDPDSKPFAVPLGEGGDSGKIYERIWKVDEVPYQGKLSFGGIHEPKE